MTGRPLAFYIKWAGPLLAGAPFRPRMGGCAATGTARPRILPPSLVQFMRRVPHRNRAAGEGKRPKQPKRPGFAGKERLHCQ